MSVELELAAARGVRLFVPIQIDAKDRSIAASVRDLFKGAFVKAGYQILRITNPRMVEGQAGDVVRNEIAAYQKARAVASIDWSLVVFPGRDVDADRDPIREAILTVEAPIRAVVLAGDPLELVSVVVTLTK
jgi:hypothetical protein